MYIGMSAIKTSHTTQEGGNSGGGGSNPVASTSSYNPSRSKLRKRFANNQIKEELEDDPLYEVCSIVNAVFFNGVDKNMNHKPQY